MKEISGCISEILNFSLHDGPGIRTSVFLKGCPLNCFWCHNPETKSVIPRNLYSIRKCVQCGACSQICPAGQRKNDGTWVKNNQSCIACGKCVDVCPVGANKINGSYMTAEEVFAKTVKDRMFYEKSGGGVTISGGEPFMQGDFLYQLVKLHSEAGIHVAIETCGYAQWKDIERTLPYIDLFLYDWKITDPIVHKEKTGVYNELIKDNLCRLNDAGAKIVLRCPIIPGVNDNEEHFKGIGRLANELTNIQQVDVLPYHALGNDKRKRMGFSEDKVPTVTNEMKAEWKAKITECCNVPVYL